MLLHFAGTAAAPHADIFDGAAEPGGLVPLKVGQADENIGVHHRAAYFGSGHILAALHRHLHLIGSLQPVRNDDLAAGGKG